MRKYPRGNFVGYDFLKAYAKRHKMRYVYALREGALVSNGLFYYVTLTLFYCSLATNYSMNNERIFGTNLIKH